MAIEDKRRVSKLYEEPVFWVFTGLTILVIVLAILACQAPTSSQARTVITETTLQDGTRCAVVWGPYTKPSGISCDWRH